MPSAVTEPKVTEPLYPAYLPTRPEGYSLTVNVPPFEQVEPGTRADPAKPEIFTPDAKIKNITPRIGAEIHGVQLSQLSKEGLDQVALFAAERGVLVFRDQDFKDIGFARQREIVSHYGPLHQHPSMGYPKGTSSEFHVIYADEKVGSIRDVIGPKTSYELWHIDQTFTHNTPSTTFFWVLETPSDGGGDTAFTSITEAYKALSPTFRERLHGLTCTHSNVDAIEITRRGYDRVMKEEVKADHPLIIEHPVTKEPAIFINLTAIKSINGMKPSESDLILNFLNDHIRSLDFSCRCKWEPGTVVIWDQRTVAHSAIPDYAPGSRRHMVRIAPYGSEPKAAPLKQEDVSRE
ncbi:hypothetical protein A1O1_04644 [Capronia coronata CBS 617.96]|uniref:TauD/TfdA-like domain-containing protein n=1 Tax=Capronia coronata CBS 617.96 TaxID=1182541 RepID=W9YZJ2_9EURO|nr:uncharacterized protein A1O1_04644 [Capronia coronata CBS 617.96]EXJ87719.1 hypothetical protein A1O1_04644 [Capronia coronata CBS 617.96]